MSGDRCELENVGQFGCHGRRGLAPAVVEPDMIESDLSLRLLEQCAEIARLDRHNRLTARFFLRSEEHTSELQSLMRISYAVFCLTKTKYKQRLEYDNNLQQT